MREKTRGILDTANATLLVAPALVLLWAVPSALAQGTAVAKFTNKTAIQIEAVILRDDGTNQKDHKVNPNQTHTFEFGYSDCSHMKIRRFEIVEQLNKTVVAEGRFRMKSRGEDNYGHCEWIVYDFTECNDLDTSDNFTVTCDVPPAKVKIDTP